MQYNSSVYYYSSGFKLLNQSRLVLLVILAFKSPAWFVYIAVVVFWFFYEMSFQRKPIHCKGNPFFQTVCISHFRTFKDIADTQRRHFADLLMISNWIAPYLCLRSCLFHCAKWLSAFQICRITRRRKIITLNCELPDSWFILAGQRMPKCFLRIRKRATVHKQTTAELGDMASSHRSLRL